MTILLQGAAMSALLAVAPPAPPTARITAPAAEPTAAAPTAATPAAAVDPDAPDAKVKKREAFFNNGTLVLVEDGKVTRFIAPKAFAESGRFQIKIPRPAAAPVAAAPAASAERPLADRIEARRIMNEANQAFFNGETAKTWELVAKAEALDPSFFRIKTMKGSLLYKIGSVDLAREIWQESLAQNPEQPEIVEKLKSMEGGARPAEGLAKTLPSAPKVTPR